MTVVYSQGSLAFADSPLGFLPHGDNSEKRASFENLQMYLLTPDAQQALLKIGRRPVNSSGLSLPNLPKDILDNVFRPDWGIVTDRQEQPLRFPSASVIENALYNYNTVYRPPGNFVYCIDGSGSMEGDGWNGIKQAADILFDPDTLQDGRKLIAAVEDDAVQDIAWKKYGFRSGTKVLEQAFPGVDVPPTHLIKKTQAPGYDVTKLLLGCFVNDQC